MIEESQDCDNDDHSSQSLSKLVNAKYECLRTTKEQIKVRLKLEQYEELQQEIKKYVKNLWLKIVHLIRTKEEKSLIKKLIEAFVRHRLANAIVRIKKCSSI